MYIVPPTLLLGPMFLRGSGSSAVDLGTGGKRNVEDQQQQQHVPQPPAPQFAAHRKMKQVPTTASPPPPARPQIELSAPQELAAITGFLASLPQNMIPLSVDPTQPIDPQLVLDFDTRGAKAVKAVEEMVEDVWTQNPVVLYAKVRCAFHSFSFHS